MLLCLLILSAHNHQRITLAWGLRDYRHSIHDELSPFAGLASCNRRVRLSALSGFGDSGYPVIELRIFWGFGVAEAARDI